MKISTEVPNLFAQGWIHDDGVLAGTKTDLSAAVAILQEEGLQRGLELSTEFTVPGNSKSRVWCPPGSNTIDFPLGFGIKAVSEAGFVHLGSPLGSKKYIDIKVAEKVDKIQKIIDRLQDLESPHLEFVLLRSCFSLPKINYLMNPVHPCHR